MPVQNQYIIFLGLNAYFWNILKNLGKLIFQGQISMGKFTQSLLSKVFCLFSRLPSLFPLPVVMFLRPAWSGHWLSPGHRSRSCIRGLSGAGARGRREWTLMSNINQGLKPEPQPRPQNGSMGTHLKLRTQAGYVKSFYSWNKSRIHMYLVKSTRLSWTNEVLIKHSWWHVNNNQGLLHELYHYQRGSPFCFICHKHSSMEKESLFMVKEQKTWFIFGFYEKLCKDSFHSSMQC